MQCQSSSSSSHQLALLWMDMGGVRLHHIPEISLALSNQTHCTISHPYPHSSLPTPARSVMLWMHALSNLPPRHD